MAAALDGIAIIGMAGRFPGAGSVDAFWRNLQAGVESISFLSDEQLTAAGVDPALLADSRYVPAGGVLEGADLFDARFFGFTGREAELMDPQHRLFLECAVEALERAGYDPDTRDGLIGVYAGVGTNYYAPNDRLDFELAILNDKDFLTTRVAYKLNLTGPALSVQTACSSSLVAAHVACQSLLTFQCDMALAGGVRVRPLQAGHLYQEGMTLSPDGHCRAFDARAQGTVRGNAVAIVVLKRLGDAIRDGDAIHAVIKGSAVNNDGASKVGYTAPSVSGQADVITLAQAMAGIDADSVGYIEAHGTGTALGDPIEIAGLTRAFRATSTGRGFCAIGSVKTNIGHTEAAAGISGLIKAALALEHRVIPPSLHFETPNPQIDFAASPFFVNTALSEFPARGAPRRAGVSSFGIGGTNAHVVLEEPPDRAPSGPSRPWQLLVLSAKTAPALETATRNLAAHLAQHADLPLADVAYTLGVGRKAFNHRRALVCRDPREASTALEGLDAGALLTSAQETRNRRVVFMFPGQGTQYVNMARELYDTEARFRGEIERCAELLRPQLGLDLRSLLYPGQEPHVDAPDPLRRAPMAQPALFAVEYAMARLLMGWGVKPDAMIGHSTGEYAAACVAGVLSLEDALTLVAARSRLMEQMPAGAMLAVSLSAAEVQPLLGERLSLAAHNGPRLCVVAGRAVDTEELERRLSEQGIESQRLPVSHAYHSHMMDGVLAPFADRIGGISLHPPEIPYLSNVTGTWITDADATDPGYWTRHLRQPVRFSDGLSVLREDPERVLLEVGPGQTLGSLARQHASTVKAPTVLSSMRHPRHAQSDVAYLLGTLGRLWLAGVTLDWPAFHSGQRRRRLALPTYPFERQRYWIDPVTRARPRHARPSPLRKNPDIASWFYVPSWTRSVPPGMLAGTPRADHTVSWLVFMDACGLGPRLVERLQPHGQRVVTVTAGAEFIHATADHYTLDPRTPRHYDDLVRTLGDEPNAPTRIVHLWSLTRDDLPTGIESFEDTQSLGFYSLLHLAQALSRHGATQPIRIDVISNYLHEIGGEGVLPAKATLLGPCAVIPQEQDNLTCRSIDLVLPGPTGGGGQALLDQLLDELLAPPTDRVVAHRGRHRWKQAFEPVPLARAGGVSRLRDGGVYLITGGLGRIGLALAEYLARTVRARLVLIGRSAVPARGEWNGWLETHDERDATARRIRALRGLEALGAKVLPVSADVADLAQMRGVIARATGWFGALDGVIHAAGITGDGVRALVPDADLDHCRLHFRSKAHGLLVLDELLSGQPLDLCLLISSSRAVLGGPGLSAYAAANRFLDAFAHHSAARGGLPWTSVNYDGWAFPVEPGGHAVPAAPGAMTIEEGVEVFERVVSRSAAPQVIVSTRDLAARISQWTRPEPSRDADPPGREDAERPSPSLPDASPPLPNAYVAPVNPLQRTIAGIWQDVLGFERVGIHDNFFDLGGHSLLALRVVSQVRKRCELEIPLQSLFQSPTVAEMAAAIARHAHGTLGDPGVGDIVTELESLTDEQARRLLGPDDPG